MREFVTRLGCFPLDVPEQTTAKFFSSSRTVATIAAVRRYLSRGGAANGAVDSTWKNGGFSARFCSFGVSRSGSEDLAVLPVAIVPQSETIRSAFPLKLLSWFDPSEPLFKQSGAHPMVIYRTG